MTQAGSTQLGLFQKQKIAGQSEVNSQPYYTQTYGAAYLGDSLELIKNLQDCSINLILTSPPFALTRKKEYGNESAETYVNWFLPFAYEFKRVLTQNGSFVIDLGGAYLPGNPVRSIYQYELLIRLCKEVGFFWRRNSITITQQGCQLRQNGSLLGVFELKIQLMWFGGYQKLKIRKLITGKS